MLHKEGAEKEKQVIISHLEEEKELEKIWLDGQKYFDPNSAKPQLTELYGFLSDDEEEKCIAEIETNSPILQISPGEIIFVPKDNNTPIGSLHFSRCTAFVGYGKEGKLMAHFVENDVESLKVLSDTITHKFPDMSLTLFFPLAYNKDRDDLNTDSQNLTIAHIAEIKENLSGVNIETYPCTDFTPERLEQLEKAEGIPETAIAVYGDRVEIMPMKIIHDKSKITSQDIKTVKK